MFIDVIYYLKIMH